MPQLGNGEDPDPPQTITLPLRALPLDLMRRHGSWDRSAYRIRCPTRFGSLIEFFEHACAGAEVRSNTFYREVPIFLPSDIPAPSIQAQPPITLANPLHALFGRSDFIFSSSFSRDLFGMPTLDPIWADIDLSTAKALVPTLRLVSHILESPCLTDWWSWAFFGRRRPSTVKCFKPVGDEVRTSPFRSLELRLKKHEDVQRIFREHRSKLRIHIAHLPKRADLTRGPCPAGPQRITREECWFYGLTGFKHFPERPINIFFHWQFFEFIRSGRLQQATVESQKRFHFSMATVLLHELAHAFIKIARYVEYGDRPEGPELYIGENDVEQELGHSISNFVFGGDLHQVDDDPCCQKGIMISDWVPKDVKTCPCDLCAPLGEVKHVAPKSMIPQSYIDKLFDEAFWQQLKNDPQRRDALRIERSPEMVWIPRTFDSCNGTRHWQRQ